MTHRLHGTTDEDDMEASCLEETRGAKVSSTFLGNCGTCDMCTSLLCVFYQIVHISMLLCARENSISAKDAKKFNRLIQKLCSRNTARSIGVSL